MKTIYVHNLWTGVTGSGITESMSRNFESWFHTILVW